VADEVTSGTDVSPISDDDVVYRRIRDDGVNVVASGSGDRPSSAAFEPDDDGLSVFLGSELDSNGIEVRDVVEGMTGEYRIAALAVSDIRGFGLQVVRDANPADAPAHPANPAHGLVKFPDLSRKKLHRVRRSLAEMAKWV